MPTKKNATASKKSASKKNAPAHDGRPLRRSANGNGSASKASSRSTASAAKVPAKKGAAKNLSDLLEDGLKDLYWAEKNLVKALPKMEKNATAPELRQAIANHIAETQNHVTRLEQCFEALGKKAKAEKCDAMQGILEEGKSILEETEKGSVRDAGIISAAQKAEHYEIASYGTLAAFAKVLGEKDCLKQLLLTLEEERKCDELLTSIADTGLNSMAME